MEKKTMASIAGLFDPVLIRLAQELGKIVPPDSPLHSKITESAVGALRGFIEAHAEKYPALASVVTDKLANLSGFVSAVLANKNTGTMQDAIKKLRAEAVERLKKADDPEKEAERIKLELKLLKELGELTEETEPNPFEPSPPNQVIPQITAELESMRDRLKAWSEKGGKK